MSVKTQRAQKKQPVLAREHVPTQDSGEISNIDIYSHIKKRIKIKFKNEHQEQYWNLIDQNEITICLGPAGTGKTFLSVVKALDLLTKDGSVYSNIIVVKPIIEADEKLGALPGSVEEKTDPFVFSVFYIIEKLIGKRRMEKLIERGIIRVQALAYMRGINIDNAILIFEEAQNSTYRQMKTLLTRIGASSKFIISGDIEQSDRYKKKEQSGLFNAYSRLKGIKLIATHEFDSTDIVRNKLISTILERFTD